MPTRALLGALIFLLAAIAPVVATAAESRFSQTLTVKDRADIGYDRLSSEQIAVLDALIRRDAATAANYPNRPRDGRFSERLIPDERRAAGLELLEDAHVKRLDELVAINLVIAASPPLVSMGSGARSERFAGLDPESTKPAKGEIHGSFSLWYGMGSGDYSERGASMTATWVDPSKRFSASFTYTTINTKGGPSIYRTDEHRPVPTEPAP